MPMTANFVQYFLVCFEMIACLKSQCNFFCGIFVTVFFVKILNIIGKPNNTIGYTALHKNF